MGLHDLPLFMLAGFLLNITPGPDMALVLARASGQGARAGVAAALGIGAGAVVHIAAAATGLSALLLASASAFAVVKLIGALYLLYLGLMLLRGAVRPSGAVPVTALPPASFGRVFRQGALTNALNPKVALFFLAFLPQFVEPDAPHRALGFIVLGVIFTCVGTAWNVLVALMAGRLAGSSLMLRLRPALEGTIGALFIGFGVKLALAER